METNYKRRQRIALIICSSFFGTCSLFSLMAGGDSDGITATCTVTRAYAKELGGTVKRYERY